MITTSKHRKLGQQGLTVSPIGLGCMGMSEFYGKHDEKTSLETLKKPLSWASAFGTVLTFMAHILTNYY